MKSSVSEIFQKTIREIAKMFLEIHSTAIC